jgi:cysteine sulfinate desulfinase/cysteine desulfurase-like protein
VLAALGVRHDLAAAAIRMSLGALSNEASIDRVVEVFSNLVARARRLQVASA